MAAPQRQREGEPEGIAELIQALAPSIIQDWLQRLRAERSRLDAVDFRPYAVAWLDLLAQGLREGDFSPLLEGVARFVEQSARNGITPSDLEAAYLSFKGAVGKVVAEHGQAYGLDPARALLLLDAPLGRALAKALHEYQRVRGTRPIRLAARDAAAQAVHRQALVNRLVRAIALETAPGHVTERLLAMMVNLAGAQCAALSRLDELTGEVRCVQAYRLPLSDLLAWQEANGDPISRVACGKRKPVCLLGLSKQADTGLRTFAERFGVERALVLPLLAADRCLGAVQLFDPTANAIWSARQVSLLSDLLAQGTLALQNTMLVETARQHAHDLGQLNEAAKRFAELHEPADMLVTALRIAVELVSPRYALLWRPLNGRWELVAASGRQMRGKLPLKPALADAILMHPQAFIAEPDLLSQPPLDTLQARSALFVPVHSGGAHRAIIGLFDKTTHEFGLHDVDVLSALEYQLALSLRNAELLQGSQQLTERLRNAVDSLGSALAAGLDVQDILGVLCRVTLELTHAEGALAFLQGGEGMLQAVVSLVSPSREATTPPPGLLQEALRRVDPRRPSRIDLQDAPLTEADRSWLAETKLRSATVFPLVTKQGLSGVLLALRRSRQGLSQLDRRLLGAFVHQAAAGMDNIQLFQNLQKRLVELVDFTYVSSEVSATLEQPVILTRSTQGVQKALGAPYVFIALLDRRGYLYIPPEGQWGLPEPVVSRFQVSVSRSPLVGRVVTDRETVAIASVPRSEYRRDLLLSQLPTVGSLALVPLGTAREGVLGILGVAYESERELRPHEQALIAAYANQAALALGNALLYQEVVRHVQELGTVLDVTKTLISSLELDEILHYLLESTTRLLGATVGCIMLLDEASGTLVPRAAVGLPIDHPLFQKVQMGEGIAGTVAATGQPIASRQLVRDGRFKAREAARAEGLHSLLAVPMATRGKVRGVLNVLTRREHEFTEAEKRLLTTVASEASVAIENAELYESAREQARSMRVLMEEVNHRIKNNLQSILGIVQLQLADLPEAERHARDALQEVISRIQAIAVVHELLLVEDVRAVDIRETARRILENARQASARPDLEVTGHVTGARVRLPSKKATSLASIINELVINSIKHAFVGRTQGNITISMQEVGGQVMVQVKDDGVGLPEGFDLQRDAHLGLRIVQGMVQQDLQGELVLSSNGGTVARLTFSK